ncbi:hypothetical protein [Nonomuraea aridisoli]|uniref:Uncharacterized protein n=1 Tax=Nonomuraea aridisoli TaxID=2070368 RepID=A0A2W2DP03_9ACTN|nr:hypothetical protein [Nonomuraea aridisoli]PZG05789.1 hypothetical protein C1J01_43075 [Nonomuraea aridisoli]
MPQRGRFLEEGRPARGPLLARRRIVTRPARLPAVTPLTRIRLTPVVAYGPGTATERGLTPVVGPQPGTLAGSGLTPVTGPRPRAVAGGVGVLYDVGARAVEVFVRHRAEPQRLLPR